MIYCCLCVIRKKKKFAQMCALRLYIDVYICVTSIYSLYSAIAGVAIAFFEIYDFINQTFEKSSPVLQNKTASILSMVLATVGQ